MVGPMVVHKQPPHSVSASTYQGHQKQARDLPHQRDRLRLGEFIRRETASIVAEWETFARTRTPAAQNMAPLALRDHIYEILRFIVSDIVSSQTSVEQAHKAHGDKLPGPAASAAQHHAALRLSGGFDIEQMVSEYRALRFSVIKLWRTKHDDLDSQDILDLIRFNESIDQAVAESVSYYTAKSNYARDLLMGILSHDLRTPLNVISMSAHLLLNPATPKERLRPLATQIVDSEMRIAQIMNDLLDVTHARCGSGLSVTRTPMDMGIVTRQIVDEMRAAHQARTIFLDVSGNLAGRWDKARIGQVLSNLIGNAVQYSSPHSPIGVTVKGPPDEVTIAVHNEGQPIPQERMGTIFDSLTRAVTDKEGHPGSVNLGLGLYITKEIIVSHGGTIEVTSSGEDGTTFTARLPRSAEGEEGAVASADCEGQPFLE
jgi:signal transduction histidine kinase